MNALDPPATRTRRPARLAFAAIVGLLVVGLPVGGAVHAADPAFTPDGAAAGLMTLLNGERTANGMPPLEIDPFLAAQARDGTIDCPNGAGTMEGRAKDMALHDFFSHDLRICGIKPSTGALYNILDALRDWGYAGYVGENVALNGGYDYYPFPYQFGCDVRQANCTGAETHAPTSVAIASYQFMTSPGHRAVALSPGFDRFACGAWETPNAVDHYYACIYAFGPGTREAPAPTTPAPTPTPLPTPTPIPTPRVWDEIAPVMTGLTAPTVVTSANRAFVADWTATDNVAVTGYAVWRRRGSAGWSAQPEQAGTSKAFNGLSPGTGHVGIRAHDADGNWSELRQTTILVPTDDRAWAFSSGSVRRTGVAYINGTATTTRRRGARMTIRFTGTSFVLIGTTAVSRGKLRVVIDGRAYTVDEGAYQGARATSTHYRVVLLNRTLTNRAHTVVISCLGTGGRPTVDVDGIAWQS
jgi:uncharacterized protein YkwD